jgi:anti-sigma factor RsiW
MSPCEDYADWLDEYIGGTLEPTARQRVDAHLATCDACRALIHDLQQIRRVARSLESTAPPPRVWSAIAERIEPRAQPAPRPQRIRRPERMLSSWTIGLAVAAALALVVITASVVRLVEHRGAPASAPATTTASAPASSGGAATAESVAGELQQAEAHYEKAIDGLQQIAKAGQGSLDPKVAAALQQNLTVIDQAIAESRAALQAQPTSAPAQASLLDAFRTKVGLLEETIALINEMRKGNDAGAARIVKGLKQS